MSAAGLALVAVLAGVLPAPPEPEVWGRDRNRTRYLLSPSAHMLEGGEVFISQKMLAFTDVQWGVTSFLTLELGTAVPAFFAGGPGLNVGGGLKAGAAVTSWCSLAVSGQALFLPLQARGPAVAGLYVGTVTLGGEDLHLSVSGGVLYQTVSGQTPLGPSVVSLAAHWRVGRILRLLTEHLVFGPQDGRVLVVNAIGVRFAGEQFALDLGTFLVSDERRFNSGITFSLPWLDLTWNFG